MFIHPMSIKSKIEYTINDLIKVNMINVLKVNVIQEQITDEVRYKKDLKYMVEIVFQDKKIYYDYFVIFHSYFLVRFKIYRCYVDITKNSLNFTLKERNMKVLGKLL